MRLKDDAKTWFDALPLPNQQALMLDWPAMKAAIASYFITPDWMNRQKSIAHQAKYRDEGHKKETPSQYVARKKDLLELVYFFNDGELIEEILNGAPSQW
jgi:hypothetical protein